MKRFKVFWLIIFCWIITGAAGDEEVELSSDDLQRIETVIGNVRKYYYRDLGKKELLNHALAGMLAALDPHSAYLDKNDLKNLRIETQGKLGGIGVEIFLDGGLLRVLAPLDDTPASRAGIKAGDLIIQIDGKLVRNLNPRDAINMMRGKPGSKVSLTIIRNKKSKPLIFNLRRELIKVKMVKERLLEESYGYLRIGLFQESTAMDVEGAVKRMERLASRKKLKLKGMIIDLRNNPGGLLESAIQVTDLFLDGDKLKKEGLIVYTKGRAEEAKIIAKATSGDLFNGKSLVVLINEGSASAAEIVAGALQDHQRAIIVGARSFGKGLVQTVIPIDDDSAIKITTAMYYTPLGRSIQAQGIEPDINVEHIQVAEDEFKNIPRIDEEALIGSIANENKQDVSKSSSRRAKPSPDTGIKLAQDDYQLYEALQILKSQNIIGEEK
jgi:carboxyl-terminal processing protease